MWANELLSRGLCSLSNFVVISVNVSLKICNQHCATLKHRCAVYFLIFEPPDCSQSSLCLHVKILINAPFVTSCATCLVLCAQRQHTHFLVTSSLFIKVLWRRKKNSRINLKSLPKRTDTKVRVSFWIYKSGKHFKGWLILEASGPV